MKLKFTAEQKKQMQKAEDMESQEALQRCRRVDSIVSRETGIVAKMLTRLPALKANPKLREAIASLIAPYVQDVRYRAVSAFARSH